MAGLVDFALGAGVGGLGTMLHGLQDDRKKQDAIDTENRQWSRDTALLALRQKYALESADHQQRLQLDGLNAPQAIEAEQRKRQGTLDDHRAKSGIDLETWATQNGITHKQALELLRQKQAGDRSLMAMRNAAKGKGGADDDGVVIGDPDFVKAQKDLAGYLGVDTDDMKKSIGNKAKLGLPDKATGKDVSEVMKAATNVYAANPHLSPDEAVNMGKSIVYNKAKLISVPLADGRKIQTLRIGDKNFAYGRPY